IQWDDPNIDKDAERLAQRMLKKYNFKKSNSLPVWLEKEAYYEETFEEINITKKAYNNYREKNWHIFTHMIHYEAWKTIIFDQERKEIIHIINGGI
ncbi:MAG: hypothetical protein HRT43_13025, partial [Campylobacteraceae bacterium]|nr:hypothetical protein [Campylobacteraceae bacterium]